MKAIGYHANKAITEPHALVDIELPQPIASGRDVLVKVQAIAVNPVDFKIRQNAQPAAGEYRVLGWDAVGEVVAVGDEVALLSVGQQVYYAGDLTRQGSNAEYQLVDERIVGNKPSNLTAAEAAALPLTTITAYELLFKQLGMQQQVVGQTQKTAEVLLVVGAAGGVGSMLLQLAKALTGATIIATASRDSSKAWVKALGADYVVDHSKPLAAQINALGIAAVTHVASLNHTERYVDDYVEVLQPFGKLGLIDDPATLEIKKLKPKSISLHWEFMFTRSMFKTADMLEQRHLLNQVAALIEQGVVRTTLGQHFGQINAANLIRAHAELESGQAIGKIVLEGF
ncbi:zinc-binding alcohol dehydrogenase family protein [Rheinheimera sp. UJ63]|uniref:zinc-binding alcohol dehydrogenase family protein n=1 Tax=Rheinheimera sp. UJ63 TaxID=2910157 RepID=UPI001F4639A3|nr:zinc-binding alcohol dehydrogenase family protein [Rheinheimera sp. UJ63]MCF4010425.1 zinc-binding alcohol dehydrogenase family protein [Rheinheimera sp. UJ63]